jgi:uncharacterized protein (DUF2252 family)
MTTAQPVRGPERSGAELGRAARAATPRSAHANLPERSGRDAVAIIIEQNAARVPELVPLRHARMAASPFTFYRGGAAVMAADLASTPVSGIDVQLCGDAHLSNFGFFASPERRMVFDVNDFDETLRGPWEWDVKRLAASVEVAGRDRGFPERDTRAAVVATVRQYRKAMRAFAEMPTLDVWYAVADVEKVREQIGAQMSLPDRRATARELAKARTRNNLGAMSRFATVVDGVPRIAAEPPLVVPLRDLMHGKGDRRRVEDMLDGLLSGYRESLTPERARLLDHYRLADIAHKVVGVGSVGTRCWMLLFVGSGSQDPLFLQAKEARPSVLEAHLGPAPQPNAGQRVVEGQRLMQTVSDIFLGWERTAGLDAVPRDFYLRQLRDWKASADIERMKPEALLLYARLCGWTLARAHARSGDRTAIAGYLGSGTRFDEAIAEFARTYAERTGADHATFIAAIADGRIDADGSADTTAQR